MQRLLVIAGIVFGLIAATGAQERKFYPDDPLRLDRDTLDTPEPAEIELGDLYDRFGHIFGDVGSDAWTEAANANTLDEVPDSSWFTNRHGVERMSVEALVRGPDSGDGPDLSAPWTIFKSKSQGLTPGFEITDARGDRYIIKFDPLDIPELASAAEIVSTKLFYAIGYHAPENYIVLVDPEQFIIEPGTRLEDEFGDEVGLTRRRLDRLLNRVGRTNGLLRVTASKYLSGLPLGPFRYYGTRSDDPNDVIPHEHRRELRGLRVFAAWLNHDDTRAHNTQDVWVEDEGRRYIRHFLLDFGSTLGSGSIEAQLPNLSYQFWLDPALVKRNVAGFGFRVPPYRKVKFPDFPSVGRYEADAYDPHGWRNDYPNPAFVRMTGRDAFWAAKIVARFTPEEIAAVVATGQYSDPAAAAYLVETIVARQHRTASYYLNLMNPLDEFAVTDTGLAFANLSERYGYAEPGASYEIAWSVYDDADRSMTPLAEAATTTDALAPIPSGTDVNPDLGGDRYLRAEIRTHHADHPAWLEPVTVYLRASGDNLTVVGIDRVSTPLEPMR